MKKFKMLAFPVFLMLLVSILCLSGVTYAWFAQGNNGSIESFDIDVVAADGLRLSLDGKNFSSNISKSDLAGVLETKILGLSTKQFYPVTATNKLEQDGKMSFYTVDLDNEGKPKAGTLKKDDENVISFDLYIENSGAAKTISLSGSTIKDYLKDETGAYTTTLANKRSSLYARVAFVNHGAAADKVTVDDKTVYDLNTYKDTSAIIWEPNSTTHVDGVTVQTEGSVKSLVPTGEPNPKNEYAFAETDQTTVTDATKTFITIPANSITKVTVYIWIEGQDVDCINKASGYKFAVNLKFAGANKTN